MAFTVAKGSNAEHKVIDSGDVERDLTDNWVSGGPTLNVNSVDVTTIADSGVKREIGLQDHTFSVTYMYDNATNKSWDVFSGLFAEGTARNILFYPEGDSGGNPQITIPVHVTGISPTFSVGERVAIEVSYESSGVVTIDTV